MRNLPQVVEKSENALRKIGEDHFIGHLFMPISLLKRSTAKKRTRSTSCTSDHLGSIIAPDDAPGKGPTVSAPALRRSNKRGGRKTAAAPPPLDSLTRMDGEDGVVLTSSPILWLT